MSYLHPCFKPVEVPPPILPRLGHSITCSYGFLRVILHQIDQRTGNDLLVYEVIGNPRGEYFFSPRLAGFSKAFYFLQDMGLFDLRQLAIHDGTFLQEVVTATILGRRQIGDSGIFENYQTTTYMSMMGGFIHDPMEERRVIPANLVELVLPPEETS